MGVLLEPVTRHSPWMRVGQGKMGMCYFWMLSLYFIYLECGISDKAETLVCSYKTCLFMYNHRLI